jgi:hypothetical protein
MKFYSLVVVTALFFNITSAHAENWYGTIKGETGYYRASGSSVQSHSDIFSAFQGLIRYKNALDSHEWLAEIRLKPEFYGFQNTIALLKFSARGQFQQRFSKFHLTLAVSSRKNFYFNNNLDFDFSIFKVDSDLLWFYRTKTFFQISANYFYRDLSGGVYSRLDAVTITGKIYRSFSPFGKIGAGAYVEKFEIANDIPSFIQFGLDRNSGWRYGPEVSFSYSRHFVVNINYHFLLHDSGLTQDLDNEQWVQLLLGKLLSPRWSIFFLADYYFRHFPIPPDPNNRLVYVPIDNESSVYLKVEYDIQKEISIFMNLGFSKENLVYENLDLSGFKGTIGLGFTR